MIHLTTLPSRHTASLTPALPTTSFFFFFNDTATTEIYTLSLHDALPICADRDAAEERGGGPGHQRRRILQLLGAEECGDAEDRKSTRLNSSHSQISYAVFCLKKKKNKTTEAVTS